MEIERFLSEYQPIRGECTRQSYRGFLAHFEEFLIDSNLTVEAVHPANIQRWAELVKGRFNPKTGTAGLSDAAVQSHLAAVSSYYQWLGCRNKKLRNPVAAVKYHRQEPRKQSPLIDPGTATAMGEQSDSELGNLLGKLFRGSGLRLAELVSLNRRNLKIEKGSRGKLRLSVKVKGKGGRIRIVPIGGTAATALMKYLGERERDRVSALILTSRVRRISRRTVQRLVHAAAVSVGAGNPHELRHRFATDAMEGGLPDKQLKKHLGQVNLEHTYRYILLTDDGVKQAYKQAMDKICQRSTCPCSGAGEARIGEDGQSCMKARQQRRHPTRFQEIAICG